MQNRNYASPRLRFEDLEMSLFSNRFPPITHVSPHLALICERIPINMFGIFLHLKVRSLLSSVTSFLGVSLVKLR